MVGVTATVGALSGFESNPTEQDGTLTRHIIRVTFERDQRKQRGLITENVAVVLVHVSHFAVPRSQATRPRLHHHEGALGLRPFLPDDRSYRGT